jgi:hypothetical protein
MTNHVTPGERFLLVWLGEKEFSQYGECNGSALDALVERGFAQVHGEGTETNNSFIAKGRGIMFRAVSLTDAGRAAFATIKKGEQP